LILYNLSDKEKEAGRIFAFLPTFRPRRDIPQEPGAGAF
jgi:hypothetical protein